MASLIEDNQHAADTLGEGQSGRVERLVAIVAVGIHLHTRTKASFRDLVEIASEAIRTLKSGSDVRTLVRLLVY